MPYLYESHMGGLFTSEEPLDFEFLYCEECGDSDTELGYFESPEEVWETIKPENLECIDCSDRKSDYSCEEKCEKLEPYNIHGYDLSHCMNILEGLTDGKKTYIYLVCRNEKNGKIYVNFEPSGYKFGEKHGILSMFCFKSELENKIAISLVPYVGTLKEKPKYIQTKKTKGKINRIYECIIEDNESEDNAAWPERDGYYGWLDPKEFIPLPGEEFLKDLFDTETK